MSLQCQLLQEAFSDCLILSSTTPSSRSSLGHLQVLGTVLGPRGTAVGTALKVSTLTEPTLGVGMEDAVNE